MKCGILGAHIDFRGTHFTADPILFHFPALPFPLPTRVLFKDGSAELMVKSSSKSVLMFCSTFYKVQS